MTKSASTVLKQLEQLKDIYGDQSAQRKLALLEVLSESPLSRAKEVFRLHEILCFLRAYPDSKAILTRVEQMLSDFACRKDLRGHRRALANTGIASTVITYPFYWFTASWIARRWPDLISVDWANFDKKRELVDILHLLLPYSETPALDELSYSAREWINLLKGPNETDAHFLIRRFENLAGDAFGRETYFERFDIPLKLAPGRHTPSRTQALYPVRKIFFQTRPLSKERPSLPQEIRHSRVRVRSLAPRQARKLIRLAREAMIIRSRDLDAFEHAYDKDVRLIDCGRGLQFACIGIIPERRLLLEAVYGFLTLKNGVPIGYILVGSLFRSSEVAFNMFETYRGAESAIIYSRVLAMVRHLFGSDTFTVPPYQLGHDNPEALQSGAWWFYYKLGLRPHDRDVQRVLGAELKKIKRDPRHRTNIKTLNTLASRNMFLYLNRRRRDIMGRISVGDIGLRLARSIADRFGADRERGIRVCSREAARLLGVRSLRGFPCGERLAWDRWSPLIMALPGVERWSLPEKRALVGVVRAKGGQRESRFVTLFDRHRRLQKAILKLSEDEQET